MKEYPVITVPKGQFVVIDGFLIKLGADQKEPSELFLRDARNLLTFEGWNILRNSYYPNALIKLKKKRSNFCLTDNRLFFRVLRGKIPVIFLKTQGRFYCRRVDSTKSTHEAICIKVGDKTQRLKYIVYDKPTSALDYSTEELYAQQNQDLEEIKPIVLESAPPMGKIDKENTILDNIMFVSEEQLFRLGHYPIRRTDLRKIQRQKSEQKLAALLELKEKILKLCFQSTAWRLERLKSKCHRKDLYPKFEECKSQIRTNLLDISNVFFPLYVELWFSSFLKLERINQRYGILERIVIDLPARCIINPKKVEWTPMEEQFLRNKNPVDWNTLKLTKGAFPIHNSLLFQYVNSDLVDLFQDSKGHVWLTDNDQNDVTDLKAFTARCAVIDLKEFGVKYLYECCHNKMDFYKRKVPHQFFKLPKDVGDRKHNRLLKNLNFFVSYEGLTTLHRRTFQELRSIHEEALNK